ncbi:hypothetical protein BD410DRAFT_794862 [Rickenella mellea]|uniref:Uncharacterized protein n=1 Tax=Rickenella mellea TaxID=50990 RepID=A0A4Y7PN81_9AGAM|nr:hypothetical protein BD410DRAFT_794862 [Rickenella mellea]
MSKLWRQAQALQRRRVLVIGVPRSFHPSPSARKTKSRKRTDVDEYEEDGEADELFSIKNVGSSSQNGTLAETSDAKEQSTTRPDPFIVEFNSAFETVTGRLKGCKDGDGEVEPRANSIMSLLHWTKATDQLSRVKDLIPTWRNAGRPIDTTVSENFIDRALLLEPRLLVDIFADRPKYGMDIPDLPTARRILYKLVVSSPLNSSPEASFTTDAARVAASFAALYPVYGLPPATQDLTSLALLARACARDAMQTGNADSKDALLSLIPSLISKLSSRTGSTEPLNVDDTESGVHGPQTLAAVASQRRAGYTQTSEVEWKWVTMSVWDVKCALRRLSLQNGKPREDAPPDVYWDPWQKITRALQKRVGLPEGQDFKELNRKVGSALALL